MVEARRFAMRTCGDWGLASACDVVALLVSETVTNAIKHADPPVEIRLHRDGERLRVEVCDTSTHRPTVKAFDPDRESGRGMELVDALADTWGVRGCDSGKVVWFELAPQHPAL
ncbi:MAG: ATP-binding protein [Actinomycetota bacterium]|nr:ATP-binding protein [Actinomycetota bacterium]